LLSQHGIARFFGDFWYLSPRARQLGFWVLCQISGQFLICPSDCNYVRPHRFWIMQVQKNANLGSEVAE